MTSVLHSVLRSHTLPGQTWRPAPPCALPAAGLGLGGLGAAETPRGGLIGRRGAADEFEGPSRAPDSKNHALPHSVTPPLRRLTVAAYAVRQLMGQRRNPAADEAATLGELALKAIDHERAAMQAVLDAMWLDVLRRCYPGGDS